MSMTACQSSPALHVVGDDAQCFCGSHLCWTRRWRQCARQHCSTEAAKMSKRAMRPSFSAAAQGGQESQGFHRQLTKRLGLRARRDTLGFKMRMSCADRRSHRSSSLLVQAGRRRRTEAHWGPTRPRAFLIRGAEGAPVYHLLATGRPRRWNPVNPLSMPPWGRLGSALYTRKRLRRIRRRFKHFWSILSQNTTTEVRFSMNSGRLLPGPREH